MAIADATADLRKSIAITRGTISFNGERERRVTGKRVLALKWQRGPGRRMFSGLRLTGRPFLRVGRGCIRY